MFRLSALRVELDLAHEENQTLREYVDVLRVRLREAGLDKGLALDMEFYETDMECDTRPTKQPTEGLNVLTTRRRTSEMSLSSTTAASNRTDRSRSTMREVVQEHL